MWYDAFGVVAEGTPDTPCLGEDVAEGGGAFASELHLADNLFEQLAHLWQRLARRREAQLVDRVEPATKVVAGIDVGMRRLAQDTVDASEEPVLSARRSSAGLADLPKIWRTQCEFQSTQ